MKKFLAVISLVTVVAATVVLAQVAAVSVWSDYAGLHIGAKSTDRIAFRDATPVDKSTGVTNAGSVLATLTLSSATITFQAPDGSTGSVSVVTNVAVNAVAGLPSTNTVNAIVNCLREHGLAGN
jgi:uncharacterized protein YyaL (SSP411 family)